MISQAGAQGSKKKKKEINVMTINDSPEKQEVNEVNT